MSIWTHVVGCLRLDGLPNAIPTHTIDNVKKVLGPMCLYDAWNEDSSLPRGSEGSLRYEIIEYNKGLPWIAIPIWGDLRDFENINEIEEWWNSLKSLFGTINVFIRDGVLSVEVENGKQRVLRYSSP